MNDIDLVIFDCDGVLVDSETITNAVMIDMLEPYGILLTRQEYIARYVGMTLHDGLEKISTEYEVDFSKDFIDIYHWKTQEALGSNLVEVEGVRDLIRRLNVPHCVASNSHGTKVKMMLEKTGLLRFFGEQIYSAYQVANPKPAPDVYLLAAIMNSVKPENCLVIEDTTTGVRAGKAAGMTVYGYTAMFSSDVLLKAGADETFDQMCQILV